MADILGIDPDAVSQLVARLSQIQQALEAGEASYDDEGLGDADLTSAFRSFVGGWREGRGLILQGLQVSVKALNAAVQGYEECDAALRRCVG
jgi:hypothetical protein